MRMMHYFGALALLALAALLGSAWTGFRFLGEAHVAWGLFTAVLVSAAHVLLILFMIVTGRVLKEAMRVRRLDGEFLAELNVFFARKKAYPVAFVAASVVVAAAVLGYAHKGFGTPAPVHWIAGLAGIAVNLWAIPIELRALRENQGLIDRAAAELDRIDRAERTERAQVATEGAETVETYDPRGMIQWGLAVAAGAWFPYLYWAIAVWHGDFARVSLHPWIEISVFGLAVWWIARREVRPADGSR